MSYLTFFLAGAFLCNCLPHLICGLKGEPFPTPFAKPHGIGNSSPLINFFWGSFNLLAGIVLMFCHPLESSFLLHYAAFAGGFLLTGIYASCHFGKVQAEKSKTKS